MKRFLIAPFDSGLQKDKKPFQIMDDAFAELKNACVWRGRLKKRFGSELSSNGSTNTIEQALFSRAAIDLGSLTAGLHSWVGRTKPLGVGAGDFTGTAPLGMGFHVGQYFKIGADTYTITALGTPAVLTKSGGPATTHTLNTTTGALIIVAAAVDTAIEFYPYVVDPTTYTGGLVDAAGFVTGRVPGNIFKAGQQFTLSYNDGVSNVIDVFTVIDGTAGAHNMITTSPYFTTPAAVRTYNITTGVVTIQYDVGHYPPAGTHLIFYPGESIEGFSQFEKIPVRDQPSYAYDTQFVYNFRGGRWLNIGPAPAYNFSGTDEKFFAGTCYRGVLAENVVMFVTNFNATDSIWYYDETSWFRYAPVVRTVPATRTIVSARVILQFKRRLLMFDVIEQEGAVQHHYPYRCRYSWDGSPLGTTAIPGEINDGGYSFLEMNQVNASGAGYVDADTQESIISVEVLRDRVIVQFERSTYELVYTGNEVGPFAWQRLDMEFGSISTFAAVGFDKNVLTIDENGITACNGVQTVRVDANIPDYVFDINNEAESKDRVHGIRDYKAEMVYWTMPIKDKTLGGYPNTVLVYNYKNNTWSENDDCITCFGYFEELTDKTWEELTIPWEQCNFSWIDYIAMSKDRQIIAGNQQGYIFLIKPEVTSNARVMTVTNFTYDPATTQATVTIINHNLMEHEFIKLYDLTGVVFTAQDTGIHKVSEVTANTFKLNDCKITSCAYTGGGTAARVSQVNIKTKQFNFFTNEGRNFRINKVDFLVKKSSGRLAVDFYTDTASLNMAKEAQLNEVTTGSNPYEIDLSGRAGLYMDNIKDMVWRTVYFNADGNFIQLYIRMDNDMTSSNADAFSAIEVEAIAIEAKPTGRITEGNSNAY